jgi:hypothetical protein
MIISRVTDTISYKNLSTGFDIIYTDSGRTRNEGKTNEERRKDER